MILATILGNVFVITAILVEKSLQAVSNYLILSLAVTDLMVAVQVMPLALVRDLSVHWYLGSAVCDMFVSMDVLCCTASILHLVAISLDRYRAVSNIDYIIGRSARKILIMVLVVWLVSVSISIPPLFGWRNEGDPDITGMCMISEDKTYTIFSTLGAFYFPMALMLVLNFKIYKAVKSRIRKKKFGGKPRSDPLPVVQVENTQNPSGNSSGSDDENQDALSMYSSSSMIELSPKVSSVMEDEEHQPGNTLHLSETNTNLAPNFGPSLTVPGNKHVAPITRSNNKKRTGNRTEDKFRKEKIEMRRERKAARVIGIITGAFLVCWLPFFIIALVAPFCEHACVFHPVLRSIFLWLGYFNSLLNPIIYTIFNPNFRTAFRKIFIRKLRVLKRLN